MRSCAGPRDPDLGVSRRLFVPMWLLLSLLPLVACVPDTTSPPDAGPGVDSAGVVDSAFDSADSATDSADSGSSSDPGVGVTVIIGGGIAGIEVANDLGDAILLEKQSALGGRAPRSGGEMFFTGTAEQDALGYPDSPAAAAADWLALTGGEPTDTTLRWLEESASVEARLQDEGLSFVLYDDPGDHVPRVHMVVGGGTVLTDNRIAAIPETVDVRLETKAEELVIDERGVAGVLVNGELLAARTVVIASGGYAGNASVIEATGAFESGTWRAGPQQDGNGWGMLRAGASGLGTAYVDRLGAYPTALAIPGADGMAIGAQGLPLTARGVIVSSTGSVFTNGDAAGSFRQSLAVRQHQPVWVIVDGEAISELFADADLPYVQAGATCSPNIRGLAGTLGMDPTTLKEGLGTLPERDTRVSFDDVDDDVPGELCALPVGWSVQKCFGGLDVDEAGRVLDTAGHVVPGLWAVGEAAGMGAPGMGGLVGFDGSLSAIVWSSWRTAAAIRGE